MKKIESILLVGCAYSIAIIAIFFGFAAISKFSEVRIGVGQFFIILLFGQVISFAGYILKNASWHIFLRYAVHYTALFIAFCVIFIVNGNINASGGAAIFSALFIFTFFYVIVLLLVFSLKKAFAKIDKKIPEKNTKKTQPTTQNNTYTPRFR